MRENGLDDLTLVTLRQAAYVILCAHLGLFVAAIVASGVVGVRTPPSFVPVLCSSLGFWGVGVAGARMHVPWSELWRRLFPTPKAMEVARAVLCGLGLQLALPLLYWPIHQVLGTSNEDLETPALALVDSARHDQLIWALVVIVCVGAPLVEELLYRGLLLGALAKYGTPVAVLLSAGVFAAAHLQPLQLFGLFVFGCLVGAIRCRSSSLWVCIAAHAAFNATTMVQLLFR